MPEGAVVVTDAVGAKDAGIFGDLLCARMKKRGVAGLVTDGVVRDAVGIRATGLDVWAAGIAAPPAVASLSFVGWQETIGCGGVAIVPGDFVVADDDGAVIIPAALLDEVVATAPEQEREEAWIFDEIQKGIPLPGLYPMNEETRKRYQTGGLEAS
jgi:regulator of RNase E activity RraA